MSQIIYEIVTGTPNFTASIVPADSPDQTLAALGVYSFDDLPGNSYTLTVVDSLGCTSVQEVIPITTTTTTTTEPTTTSTTTTEEVTTTSTTTTEEITTTTTTTCSIEEGIIYVPEQVLFRNLEGDNFLPSEDYVGRTLALETPMTLVESGTDDNQYYIVDNVPTINALLANSQKWGLWSMTVQPQPDTVMRRVLKVSYIGAYSGHTDCCKIWTYGAIASTIPGDRMALALPNACNVTIKNSVEFERNTGVWNASSVGAAATWKHSDGTYYALVTGYNSGAAIPQVKHHLFSASSFMGTWTDVTGASNGDCLSAFYPIGYSGFNTIMNCFPIPGQAGYYAAAVALVKANGSMDYGMITFDEDLSDVNAFPITINFTQDHPPYSYYSSAIYFNNKYYYQIHDGAYNTGRRVVLSSDTINGTYSYDSTIFDFDEEWISNNGSMMRYAVASGTFNIMGNRLYYFSSGQGGTPYTYVGNYNNHECFLFLYNNCCQWQRKTSPVMISNHGSPTDFGFTWGKDHMGIISNFIVENHQAFFNVAMLEVIDEYHATPGYIDLNGSDDWNTGCGSTTTSTTSTTSTSTTSTTSTTTSTTSTSTSSTTTTTTTQPVDLLTDLISVWELDETSGIIAEDSYGTNDGDTSGATVNQAGLINKCYDFDGSNDIITLPAALKLTGIFSISMWINPDNWTDNNYPSIFGGIIFGGTTSKGGIAIGVLKSSTTMYVQIYKDTANYSVSKAAPSTGSWAHIVAIYDNSKLKLYINNGTPAETTVGSITIDWSGLDARNPMIGAAEQPAASNKCFNGKIDQVAIWSKALTTDEISTLYNSGNGLAYTSW